MKKHFFISLILFFVLFLIILLTSSISIIFNKQFYLSECKKLDTDCDGNLNVLSYLSGKSQLSNQFDDRESSHMKDVKILIKYIDLFYIMLLVLFVALIIYMFVFNRKNFRKFIEIFFLYGGFFSLMLLILSLFLVYLNFDFLFDSFHKTFFKEGTYLFNENNLLIELFPEGFFIDAIKLIILQSFILSIIFILIGYITRKFK